MVHCDNSAVVDMWKNGITKCLEVMVLVRMLYFCIAQHNIHVLVTHVAGTYNSIADALSIDLRSTTFTNLLHKQ